MKNSLRKILPTLLIVALTGSLAGVHARTVPQVARQQRTAQTSTAKVAQILAQSGYDYQQAAEEVWVVRQKGKSLAEVEIIVATGPEFVLAGVVVAKKKQMRMSPDFMFKLLRLANTTDYVKVGFDDDEDLFVRTELRTRMLDAQQFRNSIEDVSAAADKIHSEIKSFLIAQ